MPPSHHGIIFFVFMNEESKRRNCEDKWETFIFLQEPHCDKTQSSCLFSASVKIIHQLLFWQRQSWNVLTCLFVVGAGLLHCVCAHLNICNDKYSWFSYRFVTLTGTMKHSGHPGKWSWVYSNAPSPPRWPPLRCPARALVVIFISQNRYSPCEVAARRVNSCCWLLRDRCFKVKQWRRAEWLTSHTLSLCRLGCCSASPQWSCWRDKKFWELGGSSSVFS